MENQMAGNLLFINIYFHRKCCLYSSFLLTGFSSPYDSGSQKPLEEPFEMEPNVLYFVRYKAVKKFVEEGKIDLY